LANHLRVSLGPHSTGRTSWKPGLPTGFPTSC